MPESEKPNLGNGEVSPFNEDVATIAFRKLRAKLLTNPGQLDTFLTDFGVDRTSFPPADTVAIMGLIALVEIKINNGSGDLPSKKRAFANLLKIGEGESTNDVLKRLLEAALPA